MELKAKLSSQIRVLSDEEIEGMRVACKVSFFHISFLSQTYVLELLSAITDILFPS